ncbi:Structural maintenance of chromosomes protein [Aphelenchoides fujianensis]|nr:Structural maintenance of chromosomes protein [Aphelenchoides fujianensis]
MVINGDGRPFMESLEITDFKSFKGRHVIGPLKRFTAIIGPNGSGKSNLMDAISFVLGEKGNNLRVRKLGDLIHGASVGRPTGTKCRVLMNFVDAEGRRRTFSRAIISSTTSEYRVDGQVCTPQQYHHALQEIQIFIRARNFLVYQGAVEQVAMQSARDLTHLIEELSRSSERKADYERLKAEMERAEADAQDNMNRRREVVHEKKEARAEKELARNYQAVRDDLAAKNRDLFLAQLFAAEHARRRAQRELEACEREAERVREDAEQHRGELQEKHEAVRRLFRELNKLERELMKKNKAVADQRPLCAQSRQVVDHLKVKLDGARKVLHAAERKAEEHQAHVREAEQKLREARKEKEALGKRLAQESRQQKLNLDHEQLAEYRRLKNAAAKQTTVSGAALYNLQQQQESDRAVVEHERRKRAECEERIREKTHEMERVQRQIDGMRENALQFACGNALVTDSADEARRLAYGADRHRAVALDGTQFQPNGVISGGGSDLKARAKRWDEQHLRKLKDEQRALLEQLHALQANSKRELDLEMKRRQIQSLESRVRYTQLEIKSHGEQLRQLEFKLEELRAELDNIQPRIEDKEEAMRERAAAITREEAKRSGVEDAVFADFCARIGVAHIREYEERELHFHQEMERQLAARDAEVSRLENELEYLRTEDRAAAVRREAAAIGALERELKTRERAARDEAARLTELEADVQKLEEKRDDCKTRAEEAEQLHVATRKQGQARFQEFFEPVSQRIDEIYKAADSRRNRLTGPLQKLLKEELFNKADALVGVFPRDTQHAVMASGIVTYDLEKFQNN